MGVEYNNVRNLSTVARRLCAGQASSWSSAFRQSVFYQPASVQHCVSPTQQAAECPSRSVTGSCLPAAQAPHTVPVKAPTAKYLSKPQLLSPYEMDTAALSTCLQDVPEFTDLSSKAWEAAGALQGLWGDAWDALDNASDSWGAQLSNLKQDLADGKKDIDTVVDEVGTGAAVLFVGLSEGCLLWSVRFSQCLLSAGVTMGLMEGVRSH